jgi:catechol 2,3-dioxygenase-like lactoylglutathione lyase family enzyme
MKNSSESFVCHRIIHGLDLAEEGVMIGFVFVGTNDLQRAVEFYDQVFPILGVERLYEMTNKCTGVMYGIASGPTFGVVLPFNGEPAQAGNGVMIALPAPTKQDVERVHALALDLGGLDEGKPRPRGNGSAYCAYFRDRDGNKICVFHTLA